MSKIVANLLFYCLPKILPSFIQFMEKYVDGFKEKMHQYKNLTRDEVLVEFHQTTNNNKCRFR